MRKYYIVIFSVLSSLGSLSLHASSSERMPPLRVPSPPRPAPELRQIELKLSIEAVPLLPEPLAVYCNDGEKITDIVLPRANANGTFPVAEIQLEVPVHCRFILIGQNRLILGIDAAQSHAIYRFVEFGQLVLPRAPARILEATLWINTLISPSLRQRQQSED